MTIYSKIWGSLANLPIRRVLRWSLFTVIVAGGLLAAALIFPWRTGGRLPYQDHFSDGRMDEWVSYGGNWQIMNGAVSNNSDDTGTKMVTGQENTADYRMDADVRLTSTFGDAGVIVRVTRPEEGTNAFYGYYVGIRLPDELLLGKMDYGFTPLRRIRIAQGVYPNVWYHLAVFAKGCAISAAAFDANGKEIASAAFDDANGCDRQGAFGLRSFAAGGTWRRISVEALR